MFSCVFQYLFPVRLSFFSIQHFLFSIFTYNTFVNVFEQAYIDVRYTSRYTVQPHGFVTGVCHYICYRDGSSHYALEKYRDRKVVKLGQGQAETETVSECDRSSSKMGQERGQIRTRTVSNWDGESFRLEQRQDATGTGTWSDWDRDRVTVSGTGTRSKV